MKKTILSALVWLTAFFVQAQVTVDPTFNPTDIGYGDFSGVRGMSTSSPGTVYCQAIQSDGKILLGGAVIYGYNGYSPTGGGMLNLLRLNVDGTRDASFNPGTGVGSGTIYAIAVQSDGKIIIGGNFATYNGITVNGICRINSTGGFDPTFNPGLGVSGNSSTVYAISILTDSTIMIGGSFTSYNTITANGIARLTKAGGFDNTFNAGGSGLGLPAYIRSFALQTDGKLLIAGAFYTYNSVSKNNIARINSNGSIDASFNSVTTGTVYTLTLRADGKIWIGGQPNYTSIALLTSTGANDPSFAPVSGTAGLGLIYSILPVAGNKILIGGNFTSFNGTSRSGLIRVNNDGTLDGTFNAGIPLYSSVYNVQQTTDGGFVYSGYFGNALSGGNNSIEKLTSSYTVDPTFNALTGAKGVIKTFAAQADGNLIIGGDFSTYNGIARNRIARITSDGAIDTTFKPGTGTDSIVNSIAIQTDGKIIAAGNFLTYNGIAAKRIVRTDATGAIDATFATNIGTGTNGYINVVALQADGKIIIGGNFTFFNGNTSNYLARLNANGTFDNTFNIGAGGFGQVRDIEIQPDGKILVGGDFQFFNSSTIGRIARLNADGTIDNTFSPTSTGANGSVYDIKLSPTGSIFVAGAFGSYNGQSNTTAIVKLTSNGVVDNSFVAAGIFFGYPVVNIDLYPTGKLLLSYGINISNSYFLTRLNISGSIDNTFTTGTGFSSTGGGTNINKILLLNNGNKIITAGSFTSFNGVGRNRIARLTDATILPLSLQSFTAKQDNNNALLNWNTSNEINTASFTVERSTNNFEYATTGSVAAKGNSSNDYQFTDFDIASLNAKTIYYRLKMQDKDGSFSYSPTAVLKLSGKTSISLSPNPAKDIAWLQVQASATEKVQVSVVDVSGRQVMQQNKTIANGTTSLPINISALKAGMYYVQVTSLSRNETLKLVKE